MTAALLCLLIVAVVILPPIPKDRAFTDKTKSNFTGSRRLAISQVDTSPKGSVR